MPCSLPRWSGSIHYGYVFDAFPRRAFPIRSAFPTILLGRLPLGRFRGLLELHTHYGLPGCSSTFRELCREVSVRPVTRTHCSPAIESNHQLFEWVLPPLVICPLGAHRIVSTPAWGDSLYQRTSVETILDAAGQGPAPRQSPDRQFGIRINTYPIATKPISESHPPHAA
jgi:hypothetical protein